VALPAFGHNLFLIPGPSHLIQTVMGRLIKHVNINKKCTVHVKYVHFVHLFH
jgi:hypothetical protein